MLLSFQNQIKIYNLQNYGWTYNENASKANFLGVCFITSRLSVFDHFKGLALKGLAIIHTDDKTFLAMRKHLKNSSQDA